MKLQLCKFGRFLTAVFAVVFLAAFFTTAMDAVITPPRPLETPVVLGVLWIVTTLAHVAFDQSLEAAAPREQEQ